MLSLYFSFYCVFFFFKQKTAYEMRISDWSSDVCSSDLQMRYIRELFPAMVGYMVLLPVSILLLKHVVMPVSFKVVVVLLPVLPILLVMRSMTRLLRGLDALQQRIQLQAMGMRSAEHTSELRSLMRLSYAVCCLKKEHNNTQKTASTT